MRLTLFGAGGFIGSHLVDHLLDRGHEVIGLDVEDEKLAHVDDPLFTFHKGDIRTQPDLTDRLIRRTDVVVDLIAHANPSLYVTVPLEVVELNFTENLRIAEVCAAHGKRLIQYSSCEVYGKPIGQDSSWKEDAATMAYGPIGKQRWIYACAKQLLERVLYAHSETGRLDFSTIRPFNFVGPRLDYLVPPGTMGGPRVFAHYMSALLTGGPMYVVDGGVVRRTFTSVVDANHAFQAILDHPRETRGQFYNVGNPANHITIRRLAELMMELFEELTGEEAGCELVEVTGEEFYGPGYEDTDRLPPDISKLRELGWEPSTDLRSTFRSAMEHYLRKTEAVPV